MKQPHMCTIIGSSGSNCALIILFQLYGSKAELLKVIYSGWSVLPSAPPPPPTPPPPPPPQTFILEEELVQYQYNLIQFLSNLSKTIPHQKTTDIILQMLTSLAFL